jgi:hypothetical protein
MAIAFNKGLPYNRFIYPPLSLGVPMFILSSILRFFAESAEERQRREDEAFLAESSDIYELEHRIRQLDRARSTPTWLGGR